MSLRLERDGRLREAAERQKLRRLEEERKRRLLQSYRLEKQQLKEK
jgi:hypothetical protein